ncbi:MAG TPA: hypothetical protein VMG38_03330 [Trebonia sp.]|nr:hypothetical protein [Trebonia sp.]
MKEGNTSARRPGRGPGSRALRVAVTVAATAALSAPVVVASGTARAASPARLSLPAVAGVVAAVGAVAVAGVGAVGGRGDAVAGGGAVGGRGDAVAGGGAVRAGGDAVAEGGAVRVGSDAVGRAGEAQAAVNSVAQSVESAAATGHLSGFAGVEVSPAPAASVTVYWHGAVPAMLSRFVASRSAMARTLTGSGGVTVRFQPAPYSQAQLAGLQVAVSNSPGFASSGISSLAFYPRATALFVSVADQADLARARSLPALVHTPIAVRYQVSPVTQLGFSGRYRATPPFPGGIFLGTRYDGLNYQCSAGFGMHYAGRRGAPYFVTTAAHCAARGDLRKQRFWAWGNGKDVGVSMYFKSNDDTVGLDTAAPDGVRKAGGSARIYVGNTSRTSAKGQGTAPVRGAASVVPGDLVNTSGAFSGERTGIRVVTTEMEWTGETPDGYEYRVFGAEAINRNHSNAAGQGDSGGPVYLFYNGKNDKNGVRAAGIISVGFDSHYAACTGLRDRRCFWDIGFPLMAGSATSIEREMNLVVNVAP